MAVGISIRAKLLSLGSPDDAFLSPHDMWTICAMSSAVAVGCVQHLIRALSIDTRLRGAAYHPPTGPNVQRQSWTMPSATMSSSIAFAEGTNLGKMLATTGK